MIVFSNQLLLAFSLYDLRCIILTIRKQIIAFKKGTFAPPAPPTERQEGRLLPPVPLSGVPDFIKHRNMFHKAAKNIMIDKRVNLAIVTSIERVIEYEDEENRKNFSVQVWLVPVWQIHVFVEGL